jgi:hypothetical protein
MTSPQENDKQHIALLSVLQIPLLLKQMYKDAVPPTTEAIISFVFERSEEMFHAFSALSDREGARMLREIYEPTRLTRATVFEIRTCCTALASAMLPDGMVSKEHGEQVTSILRELIVMEYLKRSRYSEEFDRLYAVTSDRGLKYGKHLRDDPKLLELLYQNMLWAQTDSIKESAERPVITGDSFNSFHAKNVLHVLLIRYIKDFASFVNRTVP